MAGQLVTLTKAAAMLGITRQTVWEWRGNPALNFPPTVMIGTRPYLDVNDIAKWIESRKVKVEQAA